MESSRRGPSAYQPNALTLGQTGSQEEEEEENEGERGGRRAKRRRSRF